MAILAVLVGWLDPQSIFIALSPDLLKMLTFGLGLGAGIRRSWSAAVRLRG